MAIVGTKAKTMTSVNAAFLQEVKDNNVPLWSTLTALRELRKSDAEPIEKSRALVTGLGELRDTIALQFSLEETYGYIDSVSAPPLPFGCADASVAKAQHSELYLQLHELCEQAEEAQYRGTISRDLAQYLEMFAGFDDALTAHESLEGELIRCGLGLKRRKV